MSKSFAELEKAEQVTVEELIATFKDYAESGAAITDRGVIGIIDRVSLDSTDVENLISIASRGVEVHEEMSEPKEAKMYRTVRSYLESM